MGRPSASQRSRAEDWRPWRQGRYSALSDLKPQMLMLAVPMWVSDRKHRSTHQWPKQLHVMPEGETNEGRLPDPPPWASNALGAGGNSSSSCGQASLCSPPPQLDICAIEPPAPSKGHGYFYMFVVHMYNIQRAVHYSSNSITRRLAE